MSLPCVPPSPRFDFEELSRAMTDDKKAGATPPQTPSPPTPTTPQKTLDLRSWARAPKEPAVPKAAAEEAQAQAKDPKVHFSDLIGIADLKVLGAYKGSSRGYDWVAATVLLPATKDHPDGARVFALTSQDTQAGSDLLKALASGKLRAGPNEPAVPLAVVEDRGPAERPYTHPKVGLVFG